MKEKEKQILDACCGSRMFWFDKNHEETVFMDIRKETLSSKDSSTKSGERKIIINPDIVADFTNMPFQDSSFSLVVFDPPHLKSLGENSWIAKKYGKLPSNWQDLIQKGFEECWRVLKPNGTLIFKWNEYEIKTSEVLKLIEQKPLFGHTSGRQAKTIWMVFFKSTPTPPN